MRNLRVITVALGALAGLAAAQSKPDDYRVYSDAPRIFLRPARLRLLTRERQRDSMRWQQFQALAAGKAVMPERGFALALYSRVSGDAESAREAVRWALGETRDLRQMAIVYDWCQDAVPEAQSRALAGKLAQSLEQTPRTDQSAAAVRSRVMAAAALASASPDLAAREMEQAVHGWWERRIVPELRAGHAVVSRDDIFALFELLHVVRDNLNLDLRDSFPRYFKDLPIDYLLSYYPASYPAAENEYHIPVSPGAGSREPDLRRAALSRAGELLMVAFDSNAPETQVLQGWAMHDHFLMRSTFGAPYEFLWANPYQPGLSYYFVPLVFHNETQGRLFVRSSWDESATWFGYFDGHLQLFQDGKVTELSPMLMSQPLFLSEAVVLFARNTQKFRLLLKEEEEVFVLGLKPGAVYQVEVDDEEMTEVAADRGGILELKLPRKIEVGVRFKEAGHS